MQGETVLIRVAGRGNHLNAPDLQRFADLARGKGATRLVLDCCTCEGMDSTFLGTIVALALGFERAGGRVYATRISDCLNKTFSTLGIDRVVAIRDAGDLPADILGAGEPAQAGASNPLPDPETLNRTMVTAHETLSGLSARNREEFKDVLTFLRQENQEKAGN